MSLRDVIRSLFPGVTDEHLARVCDELAPRVRATAPDWAGGDEIRQAAEDGQSGSGGDATDVVSVHQPTHQVGDEWQCGIGRLRVRSVSSDTDGLTWTATNGVKYRGIPWGDWRLVERDGKPWPPAQEPEPEPVAVEPATNELIERWADDTCPGGDANPGYLLARVDMLIARIRQEQAALLQTNGWLRDAERERDEAVARAEAAEAALARVEQVTAAERAVVEAVNNTFYDDGHANVRSVRPLWEAVRALRDAQEAGT